MVGVWLLPQRFFLEGKGMQRCRVCEREQPLTAFYAGSWALRCRACHRAYMRARRAAGLTQADERARYHAAVTIRGAVAENTKRWKARNPDKLRAEYAVADAIQRGTLTRQPCTVCGEKAQAHHADYTRPLEVQWLCPLHHARQHVAEGRMDHLRVGGRQ